MSSLPSSDPRRPLMALRTCHSTHNLPAFGAGARPGLSAGRLCSGVPLTVRTFLITTLRL